MKFTKVPTDTFQNLQMNAGVILSEFDPASATFDLGDIIGATTGGVSFTATPEFTDFGEDIDNVPTNMLELKRITTWVASMTGTYVAVNMDTVVTLLGSADVDGSKVVPRNDLDITDFKDIWWVGDYSDKNDENNGGFMAVHLMNALSTGGFSVQSNDNGKGNFAFTYTAHYSMSAQDTVPFEIYVRQGESE